MALDHYLNSGEVIILRRRKHWAATLARFGWVLGWLFLSLILQVLPPPIGLVLLLITLPAAYAAAPTLGVVYAVTNRRVISVGGWFWRYTEEMPLDRAVRVEVREPLLARLVGAGDLVFEPAQAGEIEAASMTFLCVPRPYEFRRCIREQRESLARFGMRQAVALAVGLQDRAVQSFAAELQTASPRPAAPAVPVARAALPPPVPPVPPAPPAAVWYYCRNGQRHGPVVFAELQRLARSGALKPQDYVWQEGMKLWVPAATVQGHFFGTPSPPRKSRSG